MPPTIEELLEKKKRAAHAFLADPTEEGWARFMVTQATQLGGITIELHEKNNDIPAEERRKVRVKIDGDSDFVYVSPEGYGEPQAGRGHGNPVLLELYDNELRLIVSPDIRDREDEKMFFSLELAREDRLSKTEWDGEE